MRSLLEFQFVTNSIFTLFDTSVKAKKSTIILRTIALWRQQKNFQEEGKGKEVRKITKKTEK